MTDPSFPEPNMSGKAARQTSPADAAGAMTRRNFVHTLAATGVALGAQGWAAETKSGEMIYRTLGRTGEKVSALTGRISYRRAQRRAGRHSHRPQRHRSRHHLHGQLLGLPRRQQRNPHGQSPARRVSRQSISDDEN